MPHKHHPWILLLVVALLLPGLACNFITGETPATATPAPAPATELPAATATDSPTATAEAAASPADPGASPAIADLDDLPEAVIQIEAQGTFVDPQVGLQLNAAGRGSGFIIDESGLALTNNHVVTGAGLLRVWLNGESEPRNARVLAVSECSDLALIDLDGDGYRYLEWYEGAITPGLDVYAAGFPLGDPEFTLTRGIVSKAAADGESDWASIGAVLEHDATINPGNSGGPLVTGDGRVVGVNYAGSGATDQSYAISRDEVMPILNRLAEEEDVTAIGVNGTAVVDGDLSGIWVASVESGSPADRAGVSGGDIITMLEGIALAEDGTMADYCDVLRSHGPDDVLSIQVLRFETEEVLEGRLNGAPLAPTFSFAQAVGDEVADENPAGDPVYDYVAVSDDSGAITMEVPAAWGDIDGSLWEVDGEVAGASLFAAADFETFNSSYAAPGVIFIASESLAGQGDDELLAAWDFEGDCVYEGQFPYEDNLYAGAYDLYTDCGGESAVILTVAARPEDGSFVTLLLIQVVTDADLEAADHILDTFVVVGALPGAGAAADGGTGGGEQVTLDVLNESGTTIWYIYISPSNSDSWGEDWLDTEVLMDGATHTFTLAPGIYDLMAVSSEDETLDQVFEAEIMEDMEWTIGR